MHALVIVILSIALFAVVLFAGINNINTDYFNIQNKENKIEADVANFSSAFSTYESLKGFKLPLTNWEINLSEVSKYNFSTFDDGSVWGYNSNVNGYYICLSNDLMSKNTFDAVKSVANEKEYAFLNENCGSDENSASYSMPTEFPAKAALTYWITL
jgi:hypothetical protein